MINNAADYFELLKRRDLMLQHWLSENKSKKKVEKHRKEQFLRALQSFNPVETLFLET